MSYNFPASQYGAPTSFTQAGYQAPSNIPSLPSQAQIGYQAQPASSYPSFQAAQQGYQAQPLGYQAPMQSYQAQQAPTPSYNPPLNQRVAGMIYLDPQPNNSNRIVVSGPNNSTYAYRDFLGTQLGGTYGKKTGPEGIPAWSFPSSKYQQVSNFVQQANAGQIPRNDAPSSATPSAFQRPNVASTGLFNPPSPGVRPVQTLDSQSVTLDIPNRYLGSDGRTHQIVVFNIIVPTVGDHVQVTIGESSMRGRVAEVNSVAGIPTYFTVENLANPANVGLIQLIGGRWRMKGVDQDHTIDFIVGDINRTAVEFPVVPSPLQSSAPVQVAPPVTFPVIQALPAANIPSPHPAAAAAVVVPANTEVGVAVAPGAEVIVQSANNIPGLPALPPIQQNPFPTIQPIGIPTQAASPGSPFSAMPVQPLSPRSTPAPLPQMGFSQSPFPSFPGQ